LSVFAKNTSTFGSSLEQKMLSLKQINKQKRNTIQKENRTRNVYWKVVIFGFVNE
jgi:hypothetical protein